MGRVRGCCTGAHGTAHNGFVSDWGKGTPLFRSLEPYQPLAEGTALLRLTLGDLG